MFLERWIESSEKLFIWIIRSHKFFIMTAKFPFSRSSSTTLNKDLLFFLLCPFSVGVPKRYRKKQNFPEKQSGCLGGGGYDYENCWD